MKDSLKFFSLLLLPFLLFTLTSEAQTTYKVSKATLSVSGTSSLHDWTMTSESATGEAVGKIENNSIASLTQAKVSMKVETLKSGKSGMDSNAYKAIDTKKNPEITFVLKDVKSITKKDGYYLVDATGTFTIAGTSKTLNVQAKAYPSGNSVKLTGSNTFNMTDFKVDPPTALMGTIKTGDTVTINYELTFKS